MISTLMVDYTVLLNARTSWLVATPIFWQHTCLFPAIHAYVCIRVTPGSLLSIHADVVDIYLPVLLNSTR